MSSPQDRLPRLDELPAPAAVERSERGRVLPPDLDDRRWQDLVDEASALVSRFAPQWTDRSPSDIGMTLVELFAWLTESLIYRLNRVPEKQYVALLNLLGITRRPAQPPRTLLTFTAAGGTVEVGEGTPAQTPGSEVTASVVFEVDAPVLVVPAAVESSVVAVPPATAGTIPPRAEAPAGAVGVRLAAGEALQVSLGLRSELSPLPAIDLYVEPFRPPVDRQAAERIDWLYAVATSGDSTSDDPDPPAWAGVSWGRWRRLTVLADGTAGLVRPGVVRLRAPAGPEWVAVDPTTAGWSVPGAAFPEGARIWLGLRIGNVSDPGHDLPPVELDLDRLLPNTTTAAGVGTVLEEELGRGTGRPRQVLRLARWPVYARPSTDTPYDHIRITVGGVEWRAVDYLPEGPGRCFLLDPVTGEIAFGDHDPASGLGRGSVPGNGQLVRAERYRYVAAGSAGNVPARTVQVLAPRGGTVSPPPGTLTGVYNPVPAVGGLDEEPIEETKRRAPEVLRNHDRAVTADDYEQLARTAAPGIAIVRCLPPRRHTPTAPPDWLVGDPWTYGNLLRAPGVINLIVVPDLGSMPEPTPSLAMVQDVIRVLDRRRAVATALHVTGPRYVPVKVVATAVVFRSAILLGRVAGEAEVQSMIVEAARAFLHPVHGGHQGRGWQVGQGVNVTDVYQAIRLAEDIGYITALDLAPQRPRYFHGEDPNQRPITDTLEDLVKQVRVADYELICCGDIDVAEPTVEET